MTISSAPLRKLAIGHLYEAKKIKGRSDGATGFFQSCNATAVAGCELRLFPTVCNSCPELREGQKNLHILQITDDRILPIIRGSKFKYIKLYIYFFMADGSLKFGKLSTVRTVRNQILNCLFPKKVVLL